jgi:hypothetical protein
LPAVAINGWSPEVLLPDQWATLLADLETSRPVYIFVQHQQVPMIRDRGPEFLAFVEDHYIALSESEIGTWYELDDRR